MHLSKWILLNSKRNMQVNAPTCCGCRVDRTIPQGTAEIHSKAEIEARRLGGGHNSDIIQYIMVHRSNWWLSRLEFGV